MGVWDFDGFSTSEYTHDMHTYPARLNPRVARRLIDEYGSEGDFLLDPFCGSGTSLVEARLAGLHGVGFDLNPTASKISLAKSQNYDSRRLRGFVLALHSGMDSLELKSWDEAVNQSGFEESVIRTWYPDRTVREIASCLDLIDSVDSDRGANSKHRLFARIALSHCIRRVSIQRNQEWKNYRIEGWREKSLDGEYRDLLPLFREKLLSNLQGVEEYNTKLKQEGHYKSTGVSIHLEDSVSKIGNGVLPGGEVDLVVTSPPYGDSATTMAYEQFSWQTNVWLGLDRRPSSQLARDMMGGTTPREIKKLGHPSIDTSIGKMSIKMAKKNFSFYYDYLRSIERVSEVVKEGGYICYIVGNRTSGGQNMRMDLFTRWAFKKNGFKPVGKIREREIKNSKMPGAIAITEGSGKKTLVRTMNKEFIVICRKES